MEEFQKSQCGRRQAATRVVRGETNVGFSSRPFSRSSTFNVQRSTCVQPPHWQDSIVLWPRVIPWYCTIVAFSKCSREPIRSKPVLSTSTSRCLWKLRWWERRRSQVNERTFKFQEKSSQLNKSGVRPLSRGSRLMVMRLHRGSNFLSDAVRPRRVSWSFHDVDHNLSIFLASPLSYIDHHFFC